jgi:hypothetical protein
MNRVILCIALCGALALAGCGNSGSDDSKSQTAKQATPSAQEQAQTHVCSARANIKKQVDALDAMTKGNVTIDGVRSSLRSIADSVKTIGTAQDDLSPDRKQQVQDASAQFKTAVKNTGSNLIKSVSRNEGKQQLQAAAQELKQSYQQALEPIDCA